ncbi:MAG: T9SS type A sorting domain-containing protein [Saprospiraceae bacterium]|nr:T9SS type A sorting domain-containing protein [Saprospiraceae bacterium]
MKKFVFLLTLAAAWGAGISAQNLVPACGTSFQDQLQFEERLLRNVERAESGQGVSDRGAIQYVPVHFHLVGDANSNGKVKEYKVLDQLCGLNAAYAPMDIRFYLSPHPVNNTLFNYAINSTNVYSNQTSWFTMDVNRHPNAMNIYIVEQAATTNDNPPGVVTLAYYSPSRDWVVSRKDQINGQPNNSTLPHEVGHFFSLQHTFYGWESDPFDSDDAGWPKAPATSPDGVPTERVNGTNCNNAGDKICDTPPDYNFGLISSTCTYSSGAQDPLGTVVDPQENNMMGYFETCSNYVFSQSQQNAILSDRNSVYRNYLDNNFSPAATEITVPTNLLVSPASAQTVPYYDEVTVEWNAVPGATYYLLELDIVNAYSTPYSQSFVVKNATSKLLTTLLPNRTYYWRVRPFNEYYTCTEARQRTFKTTSTSAIRDIAGLSAWQISPNPLRNGAGATVLVNAEKGFDAAIRVYDMAGRVVFQQTEATFAAGETRVELPLTGLENGMYFVILQNQEGQSVRKLSVLR